VHRGQVGSGFGDASARALRERLDALRVDESPFTGDAPVDGEARWVRPELRADVAYAELTAEGRLRAPVFLGLHEEAPPEPPRLLGSDDGDERILRDGDREIRLTNLSKLFWAPEGITKGDLLEHYARVAGVLVPHLEGRPMILKRYPDGADAEPFFQHNIPQGAPDWIPRVELARSDKPDSEPNTYVVVDDALTLMWVVNLGCIDLNPWQSRAATPDEPTHVLFDLDPADGLPFDRVVETCLAVRDELDALGLRGYPKTTGGTGMHVFVPVTPGFTHDVARLFAAAVAERLVAQRPDLVTTRPLKADRGMRVYLDANQNGRGRSISSVYSVRPRRGAPVATPLAWEEVREGIDPRDFTMAVTADRVARLGDLFAPVLTDLQDLVPAVKRLAG
jgi:bifunctional non-homologous end joining protein LigD